MITSLLSIVAASAIGTPANVQEPGVTIEAPGPDGPLEGTWLKTGQPNAPIILIIPGSGPTDRDGNNPLGVRAATYKLLAEEMQINGISSIRADKRGSYGSFGAVKDLKAVYLDGYVEDIRSWVDTIRTETGAACIWLLGHSEGGLVALKTAQNPEGICGLILVAAAGRPLIDVMKEQFLANPANEPIVQPAFETLDLLAAGKRVDVSELPAPLPSIFAPPTQDFLIRQLTVDPRELASQIELPMLILQGDNDIQVNVADAQELKNANDSAELVLLEQVNHVLKIAPVDSPGANFATYNKPDLPLAESVVPPILSFVKNGAPTAK